MPPWITQQPDAVTLSIKAVPGARRSETAGPLGDRLKLRVAAPPEGGKANKAICEFFAKALGVRKTAVSITAGQSDPHKTIRIDGVTAEQTIRALCRE